MKSVPPPCPFQVGEEVIYVGPNYYRGKKLESEAIDKHIGELGIVKNTEFSNGYWHIDVFGYWIDVRGFESNNPVTEEEIADLFHLKPTEPEIDWRLLFKEYATAVATYEGVDFLGKIDVNWTDEEWKAVNDLLN